MQIGPLQVLLPSRELLMDGEPVRIGSRAFDILEQLILADGKLVSKDDLILHVWPDTIVEETNLRVQMSTLRKLLGKSRNIIKTIPGRGYQLVAEPHKTHSSRDGQYQGRAYIHRNMLAAVSTTICRDATFTDESSLLGHGRDVTPGGAGCVGGTRLGIKVARALENPFPDNIFVVSLESAVNIQTALNLLFKAFGVSAINGACTLEQLLTELENRLFLVVFDDCEHIFIASERAESIAAGNAVTSVSVALRSGAQPTVHADDFLQETSEQPNEC